jgi:hypothetical protein
MEQPRLHPARRSSVEAGLEDRGLVALDALLAGRWPGTPYTTEPITTALTVSGDLRRRRLARRLTADSW